MGPPSITILRADVDQILREHANACLVRGTGSMYPAIRRGRAEEIVAVVIFDRSRDFNTMGFGDLVLFSHNNALVVHQLAKLDNSGWTTSGLDNHGYDSGRVTRSNYRGLVTQIYNIQ